VAGSTSRRCSRCSHCTTGSRRIPAWPRRRRGLPHQAEPPRRPPARVSCRSCSRPLFLKSSESPRTCAATMSTDVLRVLHLLRPWRPNARLPRGMVRPVSRKPTLSRTPPSGRGPADCIERPSISLESPCRDEGPTFFIFFWFLSGFRSVLAPRREPFRVAVAPLGDEQSLQCFAELGSQALDAPLAPRQQLGELFIKPSFSRTSNSVGRRSAF
jgi:hypothetical protein